MEASSMIGGLEGWTEQQKSTRHDDSEIVTVVGARYHLRHGRLHRRHGPAVVTADTSEYWVHGQLHRRHGPAVMRATGRVEEYWRDGKRHRFDGPAVVWDNGNLEYWQNGHLNAWVCARQVRQAAARKHDLFVRAHSALRTPRSAPIRKPSPVRVLSLHSALPTSRDDLL